MRNRLVFLLLVLVMLPSVHASSWRYDAVLEEAVEASAAVGSARIDLDTARRDLERVEADPTSLLIARLQAEHAAERALGSLATARLRAEDAAASAYGDVLEAADTVAIAEAALAIAERALEATAIRLDAGAATRLDFDRAENDRQGAARDLDDATARLTSARNRLASLVASDDAAPAALDPMPAVADTPALERLLERAEENAQVRAALQQVALAEAQFAAVDNPISSARADIEAARDRLAAARLQLGEQRRSLTLLLRQAHDAAGAAQSRLRSAEASLGTAREDERVQALRFDSGVVSALALEQTRLQRMRLESQARAAEHALAAALRQFESTLLGVR